MKLRQPPQTILDAIGIKTAAFTAAVTDIITSNAHGLKTGDMVVLTTTDTLPAGLATGTVYFVTKINANTFYLRAKNNDNGYVDVTDTGTGTHTWTMHDIGNSINVESYRNAVLEFATDGGGDAAFTIKFQGSASDTCPDFSAAQSVTNHWDYIQTIDLESGDSIDGDTGITLAGADDYRLLEVNINHLRWINAIISSWTQGEVTIKLKLADNL